MDHVTKSQAESVVEPVHSSIKAMCIGQGDVRSRLFIAVSILLPLRPNDFPEHLRGNFERIISESTKHQAKNDEGRLKATMNKIQNRTGDKIANKIFDLYGDIQKIRGYPLL
jgi:hypothetical protein